MSPQRRVRGLYVGFVLLGDSSATGQTLCSIFDGCKDLEILQVCMDYTAEYHQSERATVYLSQLRSKLYCFIKNKYRSCDIKEENTGGLVNTSRVAGSPIVNIARGVLDTLPRDLSEDDYCRLDAFRPEFIYTLGENIATCRMALKLSKRYDIPIVIHVMDNLEDSFFAHSWVLKPFRCMYLSLNARLFNRSIENIAIGEKMAQEYSKRHEQPFTIAMNCLDNLHAQPNASNKQLKLIFSGGIHGGRANTLQRIAEIIERNAELSNGMELLVYTSPKHVKQFGSVLIEKSKLMEYVPREKLFENLGQSDILLHVESFDEREIEFFRYSMSTKIPEYLSVGRPILCFGPKDICTVDYIKRKGVGISVDTEEQVETALLQLLRDKDLREHLGQRALQVAQEEHLQEVVAGRVTETIERIITKWSECNAHRTTRKE